MRTSAVIPIDAPCDFGIDEMFFSTTDPKGIIRSGNEVFARVSGYPLAELVGQPHNIIRHPDMPRVVFRLLWASLQQGLPIAALVKNMAKDGRYYWVVALVTPVPGGFLSVRFKPSCPISGALQGLYTKLRAVEAQHGDGGAEGRAGMDAAERLLGEELARLGFTDYDSFMWKFLHEEIKSRDCQVSRAGLAAARPAAAGTSEAARLLLDIQKSGGQAYAQIDSLYQHLDELTSLHDRLTEKSASVFDHTLNIRFVALSTTIKAVKLGNAGRSLEVIAQYLGEASARTSAEVLRLTGHIRDVSAELHTVIFNLAGARLQLEMMLFFGRELLGAELAGKTDGLTAGTSRQDMISSLQEAFHATMLRAVEFLGLLSKHLAGLNVAADELGRTMLALHVAQLGGKVEASRIADDDSITAMLGEIHGHIGSTADELHELGDITGRFAGLIRAVPEIVRAIDAALDRIKADVRQLAASGPGALPAPERNPPRQVAQPERCNGHRGNRAPGPVFPCANPATRPEAAFHRPAGLRL